MIQLKSRNTIMHMTAQQWGSSNIILLSGEPAVESDTGRWKIGNGIDHFSSLPYQDLGLPRGNQNLNGINDTINNLILNNQQIGNNLLMLQQFIEARSRYFYDRSYSKYIPNQVLPYGYVDFVGGETLCINEYVKNGNFRRGTESWSPKDSNTTLNVSNKVLTIDVAGTQQGYMSQALQLHQGHKVALICEIRGQAEQQVTLSFGSRHQIILDSNIWTKICVTDTINIANISLQICIAGGESLECRLVSVIDIDQMFGQPVSDSTVIDQIKSITSYEREYDPLGNLVDVNIENIFSLKLNQIRTKYFPSGMHGLYDIYDEINLENKKAVIRTGIRPYVSGDQSLQGVITDKRHTVYGLSQQRYVDISQDIDNIIDIEFFDEVIPTETNHYQIALPWGIRYIRTRFEIPTEQMQEIVNQWLDEHPEATTTVQDGSITATKLNHELQRDVSLIQSINQAVNNATLIYVQDGTDLSSLYYKKITALKTTKKYALAITPTFTGNYTIQCGTAASTSGMKDTIFTGQLTANQQYIIKNYVPTGTYTYVRSSQNKDWQLKVYEMYEDLASTVVKNTIDAAAAIKYKEITKEQFQASPYNSSIGNLDVGTIISITSSYAATDYPMNQAGRYTVMTYGPLATPMQTAVHSSGKSFTRAMSSNVWSNWKPNDGIAPSEIVITNANPVYSSFNDFPPNSIVRVYNNIALDDAPAGWNTIGHATTNPGTINAVIMTYTPTQYNPTYLCQICHIYRGANEGSPRLAFRIASTNSGSYTWSKWSIISEDDALHATNKVVDINTYQTLTFSDFDDAPINTMYQVDYNVGDTIAHNPAPGKSGVLMTYAFSVSTRHGLVQTHFAYESPKAAMYFRYGFQQSTSSYVWTQWEKVNDWTIQDEGEYFLSDNIEGALQQVGHRLTDIGSLPSLTTKSKSTLVDAINELKTAGSVSQHRIANLEAVAQGYLYRAQSDSSTSITKLIPSDAMPYASIDKVGAKTLIFNQIYPSRSTSPQTRVGVTTTYDGRKITLSGTATSSTTLPVSVVDQIQVKAGHKYALYLNCNVDSIRDSNTVFAQLYRQAMGSVLCTIPHRAPKSVVIASPTVDGFPYLYIYVINGQNYDGITVEPVIIDLTRMFGAGHEPTAEEVQLSLRGLLNEDYNEGMEISRYAVSIENREAQGMSAARIDIPYEAAFPNGMNGVGSVCDEVDFSNNRFVRRIGIVQASLLNWTQNIIYPNIYNATFSAAASYSQSTVPGNVLNTVYETKSYQSITSEVEQGIGVKNNDHGFEIYDSDVNSVEQLKQKLGESLIYYEMTTPQQIPFSSQYNQFIYVSDGTKIDLVENEGGAIDIPWSVTFLINLNAEEN